MSNFNCFNGFVFECANSEDKFRVTTWTFESNVFRSSPPVILNGLPIYLKGEFVVLKNQWEYSVYLLPDKKLFGFTSYGDFEVVHCNNDRVFLLNNKKLSVYRNGVFNQPILPRITSPIIWTSHNILIEENKAAFLLNYDCSQSCPLNVSRLIPKSLSPISLGVLHSALQVDETKEVYICGECIMLDHSFLYHTSKGSIVEKVCYHGCFIYKCLMTVDFEKFVVCCDENSTTIFRFSDLKQIKDFSHPNPLLDDFAKVGTHQLLFIDGDLQRFHLTNLCWLDVSSSDSANDSHVEKSAENETTDLVNKFYDALVFKYNACKIILDEALLSLNFCKKRIENKLMQLCRSKNKFENDVVLENAPLQVLWTGRIYGKLAVIFRCESTNVSLIGIPLSRRNLSYRYVEIEGALCVCIDLPLDTINPVSIKFVLHDNLHFTEVTFDPELLIYDGCQSQLLAVGSRLYFDMVHTCGCGAQIRADKYEMLDKLNALGFTKYCNDENVYINSTPGAFYEGVRIFLEGNAIFIACEKFYQLLSFATSVNGKLEPSFDMPRDFLTPLINEVKSIENYVSNELEGKGGRPNDIITVMNETDLMLSYNMYHLLV